MLISSISEIISSFILKVLRCPEAFFTIRSISFPQNQLTKRAEYVAVTDDEAVEAFEYLSRIEGIIPAIESAHAVAHAMKLAPTMKKDQIMVINISGRGDKDCAAIARYRGDQIYD